MPLFSSVLRALPKCFAYSGPDDNSLEQLGSEAVVKLKDKKQQQQQQQQATSASSTAGVVKTAISLPSDRQLHSEGPLLAAEALSRPGCPGPTFVYPTALRSTNTTPLQLPALQAGLAVVDGFLNEAELLAARSAAIESLCENSFQAGMGGANHHSKWSDLKARGDNMRWLYREEEQRGGRGAMVLLMDRMAELRQQLLAQGYDVGGRITFQLACYPGNGARYVRHRDASDSCPTRSITAICYLNPDWRPLIDGGHLAVYNMQLAAHRDNTMTSRLFGSSSPGGLAGSSMPPLGFLNGEPATVLAPVGGRLVVFQSRTEHEVLPSQGVRYAVTVWLHKKPTLPSLTASPFAGQQHHQPFGPAPHVTISSLRSSLERHHSNPEAVRLACKEALHTGNVVGGVGPSTVAMQGASSLSGLDRGRLDSMMDDAPTSTMSTAGRLNGVRAPVLPASAVPLCSTSLQTSVAVFDCFLDHAKLKAARLAAIESLTEVAQQSSLVGFRQQTKWPGKQPAGDIMRWLQYDEELRGGRHALVAIMDCMAELRHQLAEHGFDVGGRIEYRLACYPASAACTVRRCDVSDSCPTRCVTAHIYLTLDWLPQADGGHMAVYNTAHLDRRDNAPPPSTLGQPPSRGYTNGEPAGVLAPLGGRLILMLSDMQHEVLPSSRASYALTVWFHKAPAGRTATGMDPTPISQCQQVPDLVMASPKAPTETAAQRPMFGLRK